MNAPANYHRYLLLFLLILVSLGTLSGCANSDATTTRTTEQMKGGGPPIPGSQRPGATRGN